MSINFVTFLPPQAQVNNSTYQSVAFCHLMQQPEQESDSDAALIEEISKKIIESIDKNSSPEHLEELARKIKENNYHISTEELVDKMIERWLEK